MTNFIELHKYADWTKIYTNIPGRIPMSNEDNIGSFRPGGVLRVITAYK